MNTITFIGQQMSNRRLAKILCIGLLMQGLTGCKDTQKPYPGAGETFPLSALEQMTRVGKGDIAIEGKTLLINFWATWCAPCRKEMPALQKLSDSLDPERFAVIGISVDEDLNLIREFALQYEIRFPIFQDEKLQLASELLRINTFPETFIVSPRGVISRRISEALALDFSIIEQSVESGEPANTIETFLRIKG
jgi:thiol-disulfide isomerase/thioredoxin